MYQISVKFQSILLNTLIHATEKLAKNDLINYVISIKFFSHRKMMTGNEIDTIFDDTTDIISDFF